MKANPKDLIHYYVDAGIRDNKAGVAVYKKGYYIKNEIITRTYFTRKLSSTDAEILAVKLALRDAKKHKYDLQNIIIHTDQKALSDKINISDSSKLGQLKKLLSDENIKCFYMRSLHENPGKDAPAKQKNAYEVHTAAKDALNKKPNRYRRHLFSKKSRKAVK